MKSFIKKAFGYNDQWGLFPDIKVVKWAFIVDRYNVRRTISIGEFTFRDVLIIERMFW